jgi:hypothetical protein
MEFLLLGEYRVENGLKPHTVTFGAKSAAGNMARLP